MTVGFPTNTIILLVATMTGIGIAAWLSLMQGIRRLPVPSSTRRAWGWGIGLFLAFWLLSRLALAAYPPQAPGLTVPLIIVFLIGGTLVGILPLVISPGFRQHIRAIPETWLVGIHALRVTGFIFLALMDMKLLPGDYALPAGYGDMTVGLLAVGVVYLLAARKPHARALAVGWNLLGMLDFIVAVSTGFTYLGPFIADLTASGSSAYYVNFVFLFPAFGVPVYALAHVYSLYQLLSRRAPQTTLDMESAARVSAFAGK